MEKGYKYLWVWMALLLPFTFLGFYKTYFSQLPDYDHPNLPGMHLHTLLAAIWVILLIVQPLLISLNKRKLHRLLGKTSYLIIPLLIASMIPPMISSYDKGGSMVMPVFNVVLITLFYALSMLHRKDSGKHMRYIIGIALVFVTPTLGRIIIFYFGGDRLDMVLYMYSGINLLLVFLLYTDRQKKRDLSPYSIILIGFAAYESALLIF